METSEDPLISEYEQQFHQFVQQHVVFFLSFILLYLISYWIVQLLKGRTDNDEMYSGSEDFFVFRVSLWMCTFSLAVSFGAAMLLPFSIFSCEIMQAYSKSYYFKWLSWSLIHSLWNYVFALSNLSLFVFLPFAYFFIESQGFKGHGKGIKTRIYETVVVCILLMILLVCLADVIRSFFLSGRKSISLSLLNFTSVNLPFIYSCVSFSGVLTLLLMTPIGFARLFTVVSNHLLASNNSVSDDNEKVRYLEYYTSRRRLLRGACTSDSTERLPEKSFLPQEPLRGYQKILQSIKYPLAIIVLLLLTGISVLFVLLNTFQLLFGLRALPSRVEESNSHHVFGMLGAMVEIIIIWYLMAASLIGIYSVPLLRRMRPQWHKTSMTSLIANCATILVLSSALPVLARTLGITSFDLLGGYGNFEWLSNFMLVWTYNVLFAAASIFCLFHHFSAPVRRELIKRFRELSYKKQVETLGYKDE